MSAAPRALAVVRSDAGGSASHLVSPAGLIELYPAIKARTLRYWIENAAPRTVSDGGVQKTLPGNGLGPAVIRKGRVTLIDPERFRAWLFEGQVGG